MKQKKKNTLSVLDSVVLKLRERVSKKCTTTGNTWLHYSLTKFSLSLCRGYAKKKAKRKYEEQQKMNAYRNTVHLEDKREEFVNSHKLERLKKSLRNTV